MNIDYEYLSRIRRAVTLYTNRKTSNILEGDFHSIHKGRSMDFEDLKEYTPGDEVHDIDWKSSSRMGTILVRRYMTDRRHNMMFVCDCGTKMTGDTPSGEAKKELALMTFGTMAYIAGRNGADYALSFPNASGAFMSMFKSGADHLERLLYEYQKCVTTDGAQNITKTLKDVINNVHKRMIIFLITDVSTLATIDKNLIRAITMDHDLVAIGIQDAGLTGQSVFDLDVGRYERFFFSHNAKLRELEQGIRTEEADIINENCRQGRASVVSIKKESEIIDNIILLLERYRHGNYGYITTTV